ncbi:MAG: hypothetical protein H7Z74_06725 [Anaerolineae bacterium]|nr:hypothetical protein [Gemmatimonadaceae bacterium]
MADVFKIVFLILGTLIVFVSYWLASTALFPAFTDAARRKYQTHPLRMTFLGIAVVAPSALLGMVLLQSPNPAVKLLGAAVVSTLVLLGLIGSTGLSQRIGYGLSTLADDQQPWRRVLRGGSVLALTFVLPVIGWFVVFPWALVSGVGAAVASLRSGRDPAVALEGAANQAAV